jgi:predicted lipid-binding transport protein (Tim44 family)
MNIKKFLLTMVLAVGALALVSSEAEARRLGGGGSFGRQSQNVSRQWVSPCPAARPTPAPAAAPSPMTPPVKPPSPWKGIAGGLLGGLALGALFSHLGMGGMMGGLGGMLSSILTIALLAMVAMFIYRLLRGKAATPAPAAYGAGASGGFQPENSYAQNANQSAQSAYTPEIGSRIGQGAPAAVAGAPTYGQVEHTPWGVPADFDASSFLRNAKTYFIRLQAAWDKADINDIREFTTPEMYAEIKLEIQERGPSANVTDVVSIEAQLLGLEVIGSDHLASVKFSGMIREALNAPAEPFAEVWNLSKPLSGATGWVLAGIQQLN